MTALTAVVLVGGFGTRLRPLTFQTPKQLLPVAGVPLIERVLGHLSRHGVDQAVLSLGYRPDAFLERYPDRTCAGVHLEFAVEAEPLDTAGAIRFAAGEAGIAERFLVVNGDILTGLDLSALVAFHAERHEEAGAEGTIALTKVEDPSSFGVVPTDDEGRVLAFVEKPPRDEAPTDLINAGFYVLEASVLDRIPAGRRVNVERETFPAMVADATLFARADGAPWLDVGTPERYLAASLALLPVTGREGSVDGGVVAPVLLEAGSTVKPGAVVHESVLGEGVTVADGARVEGSVVLAGARVEERAVVTDSIVGRDAVIGEGACVQDVTVIGDGVTVPPGARLSGARVPEG
ncbi:MAG TPA: NDP-sugar synthase [Acidimicrobiales bacterium]|nr:NDP-sugar synthase [Acidimicrobiales bacterium]